MRAGLPEEMFDLVCGTLGEYRVVFQLEAPPAEVADVPPHRVRFKASVAPVKHSCRRYPARQDKFLKDTMDRLVDLGYMYRNDASCWSVPALVVAKGENGFRLVVDLRDVNALVLPMAWPSPDPVRLLQFIAGAQCFLSIDIKHGFWMIPLHEDSQEQHSVITPFGVFTPTRVLQGSVDGPAVFQARLSWVLRGLVDVQLTPDHPATVIQFIDDLLIAALDPESLILTFIEVLKRLKKHRFFLGADKTVLYTTDVTWCGMLLSKAGVSSQPSRTLPC